MKEEEINSFIWKQIFIASFSETEIYAHGIFLGAKLHLRMIERLTIYDNVYSYVVKYIPMDQVFFFVTGNKNICTVGYRRTKIMKISHCCFQVLNSIKGLFQELLFVYYLHNGLFQYTQNSQTILKVSFMSNSFECGQSYPLFLYKFY